MSSCAADGVLIIDGGVLEGGGQILRNASSYSCIFERPVTINNIRAGREKPGLRPQHLTGLELLKDLSNGKLENGYMGSTTISLYPRTILGGSLTVDTRTAGSVCLLIQSALPCLLFAKNPSRLTLKGGTNADMAPPVDYLIHVLQPMLQKMGVEYECQITRRGFYPKGGGEVVLKCNPIENIRPIVLLQKGDLSHIFGLAYVAGALPIKVARIMMNIATSQLKSRFGNVSIDVKVEKIENCDGTGSGIILVAETCQGIRIGASSLGARGKKAEDVAFECYEKLSEILMSNSCVDDNLQDQLIIFMALASGTSQLRCRTLTLHTQTAIHVARLLTQVLDSNSWLEKS